MGICFSKSKRHSSSSLPPWRICDDPAVSCLELRAAHDSPTVDTCARSTDTTSIMPPSVIMFSLDDPTVEDLLRTELRQLSIEFADQESDTSTETVESNENSDETTSEPRNLPEGKKVLRNSTSQSQFVHGPRWQMGSSPTSAHMTGSAEHSIGDPLTCEHSKRRNRNVKPSILSFGSASSGSRRSGGRRSLPFSESPIAKLAPRARRAALTSARVISAARSALVVPYSANPWCDQDQVVNALVRKYSSDRRIVRGESKSGERRIDCEEICAMAEEIRTRIASADVRAATADTIARSGNTDMRKTARSAGVQGPVPRGRVERFVRFFDAMARSAEREIRQCREDSDRESGNMLSQP